MRRTLVESFNDAQNRGNCKRKKERKDRKLKRKKKVFFFNFKDRNGTGSEKGCDVGGVSGGDSQL